MPTFAPGPSTLRAPFPTYTPVVQGTPFQTLGAALISAHQIFDVVVGDRFNQIAALGSADLDGDFSANVAPAADAIAGLGELDLSVPTTTLATLDAIYAGLVVQAGDLPDPDAPDPDVGAPPADAPDPGAGKDITIGGDTPAPAPDDLVGPSEVNAIVVAWFQSTFGVSPTTADLLALAAAAGYVQGSTVPRSFILSFLASPAARAAVGR